MRLSLHELKIMKLPSKFLISLILCLCFGTAQSLAQEKLQEFIVLKIIIKKEFSEQQLKIPVARSFYESVPTGSGFGVDDCIVAYRETKSTDN
jgi:hypothetical protein